MKAMIRTYAKRTHGGPTFGAYLHMKRWSFIAHTYLGWFCIGIQGEL